MLPLRATRPHLLARHFILACVLTLSYKNVLILPFYSPSSIFFSSLMLCTPLLDIIAIIKSPRSAPKLFYSPISVYTHISFTTSFNFYILD